MGRGLVRATAGPRWHRRRTVTVGIRPGALSFADTGMPGRVDLIEDLGDSSIVNVESAGSWSRCERSIVRQSAKATPCI